MKLRSRPIADAELTMADDVPMLDPKVSSLTLLCHDCYTLSHCCHTIIFSYTMMSLLLHFSALLSHCCCTLVPMLDPKVFLPPHNSLSALLSSEF